MRWNDDSLNLAFWSDNEEEELGPRLATETETWDTRARIRLPRERAAWTRPVVGAAVTIMVKIELRRCPQYWRGLMLAQRIRREDFATFCAFRGYLLPDWWATPETRSVPKASGASRGRRPRLPDEPLLEQMRSLVEQSGGKLTPWDAAGLLAGKAEGKGTPISKQHRLFEKSKKYSLP